MLQVSASLAAAMNSVIEGKQAVVRTAITVLLAEGHLLVEDVPGVGKTLLAKTLARSIDCTVRRVQFTPDLLPSDITGVSVFNQDVRDFEFRPGAIFANVVVGDEINRASPKTQSALLESMEEAQVTVDGKTYSLPEPFMVMATQNPIEMEGTYPLPEAQRDRFMARISMGYPSARSELDDARRCTAGSRRSRTSSRSPTPPRCPSMVQAVREVHASQAGAAVHRRPHPRDPLEHRTAAGRLPARHAAPAARRRGPMPPWPAATTCCPTTCNRSPFRCSPTG